MNISDWGWVQYALIYWAVSYAALMHTVFKANTVVRYAFEAQNLTDEQRADLNWHNKMMVVIGLAFGLITAPFTFCRTIVFHGYLLGSQKSIKFMAERAGRIYINLLENKEKV